MNVKRGTPEWDVMVAALEVATAPPLRRSSNVFAAVVPWTRIDKLRSALEAAGIDWRKVKEEQIARSQLR